ncbi:MAG: GAF domain-containing protein [Anaerolineaceae bacterium]|nr:GAF domain-containing protein [Anaerolineaceae bacterium]
MNTRPIFPLRRDLSVQLIILFAAFMTAVLIAAMVFLQRASQDLEADIGSSDLALAHAIAEETTTFLDSALETVTQLAEYPEVITVDTSGMDAIFQSVMSARPDINLTYRLDAQGLMVFHHPIGPESTVGTDFSFRSYFQQAKTTREPLISLGRISPTTQQPVATAVMPMWIDDVFQGLVATNLKLQFLSDTLTNIMTTAAADRSANTAIVDAGGQIVAHSDPSFILQTVSDRYPPSLVDEMRGESGNFIASDPTGEYLYSYVPIANIDWSVVVSRPTSVAFSVLNLFRQGVLAVLIVFAISGILFWAVLSRRVIQPIERLANFSQGSWLERDESSEMVTALGQLTARRDQMGVLTRSLQSMQAAIEARLNELSTLLKTSTVVVSSLETQVVLDRILEQVEELLQVRMSAIFVLDESSNTFRIRASRNLPGWYADRVRIDPQDPDSATMRTIRSGEPVHISDTETDPTYAHNRQRSRLAGYRAILAIRLPVQHVRPSALLVYRSDPDTFTEREIRLLTNFANYATMAIENAALFDRSDTHLQEQTQRLEALIQSMRDGVVLENSAGKILYANRSVQDLTGLDYETIHNKPITALVEAILSRTKDRDSIQRQIDEALSGQGIRRVEYAQIGEEKPRYLRLSLFSVSDKEETLIGRGWIIQDITQRYELDRMKSNLVATVSHELRTPLASIKGYTTTLLADDVEWDTQSQREFLTTILQETDRLSSLVQDLLDMSRIEAGNLKINPISSDVPKLIEQAALHATPPPGNRLALNLPHDLPPMFLDPQRVEAVLRNLIENAAKYCPDDAPITVSATYDNENLVISVEDQGPGIPTEMTSQVFESFYRVDNGMTRKTTGAGLGLAIARGFVQAHGGEIWLEPRPKGTCVTFSIPVAVTAEVSE